MVVYIVVTWQFVFEVMLTAEMLANSSTVIDRFTPTVNVSCSIYYYAASSDGSA